MKNVLGLFDDYFPPHLANLQPTCVEDFNFVSLDLIDGLQYWLEID